MSKRILFVGACSVEHDASQHKLYFMAAVLARAGLPISVFLPDFPENVAFFAKAGAGVETHFFPRGNPVAEMLRKAVFVRRGNWSCIYVVGVGLRSFLLPGVKKRGTLLIQDFDELPSLIPTFSKLRYAYLRLIEWAMIAQADAFTCASQFLIDRVGSQRKKLRDRIFHLPVAISADEHRVDASLSAAIRKRMNGRSVFLYVGSMNRFYQIDELLNLARLLRERKSNAFIRVLGGGPDLEAFKEEVVSSSLQDWIGFEGHARREELASHMDAADVLLFPFHNTAFNVSRCPTKAYHYAAANRPVVTNRLGEVAKLLGASGFYYQEGNLGEMADGCERALQAAPTFDNGLSFESLTWDHRALQFAEVLAKLGVAPTVTKKETVAHA
jgi:glycosyltransferase involved in cell wall biosynthesis